MQKVNILISVLFITILTIILLIERCRKNKFREIDINQFVNKYGKFILIIFLVLIGVSRIYKFGELPYAIGVDEAGAAYDAYSLANFGVDRYLNSFPVYLINFGGGQSALYAYLNALLIKILGSDSILVSRLPILIFFTLSILIAYILVKKKQDKPTAVLFAFLIILCQWQIVQSRQGLDCNLLGPLFILDLLLLEKAKNNYQYILAGISVGITLYTYSLSYLIMPVFLCIWCIYHLYLKDISVKQLLILGSTIFIFALPLIYFLLLNMGIVEKTTFGIFTIPKLRQFRVGEIAVSNIWKYGFQSIKTIFTASNGIYYFEIPFFLIGLFKGIKNTIKTIKNREYSLLTTMTLTFFAILIPNLLVRIVSTNNGNILFIPILYFITIGIIEVIKNKKILWIILIIAYLLSFSIFELYYYNDYSINLNGVYEDKNITPLLEYIKQKEIDQKEIYMITYIKTEPYIYVLLNEKISPYEFDRTKIVMKRETEGGFYEYVTGFSNYHFNTIEGFQNYDENRIYVIHKQYKKIAQFLEKIGYQKENFEEYYILI